MDLSGVRGAEPPEASENIKKLVQKINGKLKIFETFPAILANFDLKRLILIKIKAILMEFLKALIILTGLTYFFMLQFTATFAPPSHIQDAFT